MEDSAILMQSRILVNLGAYPFAPHWQLLYTCLPIDLNLERVMTHDSYLNQALPEFALTGTSGQQVSHASLKKKWTVLYFYPKDSTPGCTLESQNFRDLMPQFMALGIQVFGVSKDSVASHERFKSQECMPFELISDPDSLLCQALGVIQEKKNYGKTYMGIDRSTFLIDPMGVIRAIWRHVKVDGHAHEVLLRAKTLMSA